ncbi:hypothetical protein QFZ80_001468 [Paenibacillus sp. V4I7]|nr:hypothetical protein [Paenibacillus sp. V4I7]MDQ0916354.1 hypothetical protein [Paenibacillus sp. V4I5]
MKYKLALISGVIWSATFSQFVFADERSPSLPKTNIMGIFDSARCSNCGSRNGLVQTFSQ